MPDPVQRFEGVAEPDRVQSPPFAVGEDAGVDLQMQMAVWVTGARRVMPDRDSLHLLDGDLDLASPGSDPGGGMVGDPADDLLGRLVLRRVIGRGDVRIQGGGQGPGFRAVDGDLDEPDRVRVLAQPAPRLTGGRVETGDPCLVPVAVQHTDTGRLRRRGWR